MNRYPVMFRMYPIFPGLPGFLQIIIDKETGRSKGFGFVTFISESYARLAIGACAVLLRQQT